MQHTLSAPLTFHGTGIHTGLPATLTLLPAPIHTGIVFNRSLSSTHRQIIPAHSAFVVPSTLNTTLESNGVRVQTIEHIMSALRGCDIHNAFVCLNGPEVPIMDGSAAPFVTSILAQGKTAQHAALKSILIQKPIRVTYGDSWAALLPHPAFCLDITLDYPIEPLVGRQRKTLTLTARSYKTIQRARTFCFAQDIPGMKAKNLANGGNNTNTLIIDKTTILTPGGMRYKDEPIRHKMLDAIGDLYTAGAPIIGKYVSYKAGHATTNLLVKTLLETPESWHYTKTQTRTLQYA